MVPAVAALPVARTATYNLTLRERLTILRENCRERYSVFPVAYFISQIQVSLFQRVALVKLSLLPTSKLILTHFPALPLFSDNLAVVLSKSLARPAVWDFSEPPRNRKRRLQVRVVETQRSRLC